MSDKEKGLTPEQKSEIGKINKDFLIGCLKLALTALTALFGALLGTKF